MANIITITKDEILLFDMLKKDNRLNNPELNIDNAVLVRTCDNMPEDHILRNKKGQGFLEEMEPYILPYSGILSDLGVKYDDMKAPLYKSGRDTIHFTINGLVGNHSMGIFSNRKYFLIEPLKPHLEDHILTMRPEDTFIKGDVKLSSQASIVMSLNTYSNLTEEELNSIDYANIILFDEGLFDELKFDEDIDYNRYLIEDYIVRVSLQKLGYPSYKIGTHGYDYMEQNDVKQGLEFINSIIKQYGFDTTPHFLSKNRQEAAHYEMHTVEEAIKNHMEYLITNSNVSEELKEKMFAIIPYINESYFMKMYGDVMEYFIKSIGLEQYDELTDSYNRSQLTISKEKTV